MTLRCRPSRVEDSFSGLPGRLAYRCDGVDQVVEERWSLRLAAKNDGDDWEVAG